MRIFELKARLRMLALEARQNARDSRRQRHKQAYADMWFGSAAAYKDILFLIEREGMID